MDKKTDDDLNTGDGFEDLVDLLSQLKVVDEITSVVSSSTSLDSIEPDTDKSDELNVDKSNINKSSESQLVDSNPIIPEIITPIVQQPTTPTISVNNHINTDDTVIDTQTNVSIPQNSEVQAYLTQAELLREEVIEACRSDRVETQNTINMLRKLVDDAIAHNRNPERSHLEFLVAALDVKSKINATAVKAQEGMAKMLAALKVSPGIKFQQNINTADGMSGDLESVLNEPLTGDDEY